MRKVLLLASETFASTMDRMRSLANSEIEVSVLELENRENSFWASGTNFGICDYDAEAISSYDLLVYLPSNAGPLYRKFGPPYHIYSETDAFLLDSSSAFSDYIFNMIPDGQWLTPPRRFWEAANKLITYKLAETIGINVPEYIFSNNPNNIKDFISAQNFDVVVKTAGFHNLIDADHFVPAKLLDRQSFAEVADVALSACISLYQKRVRSTVELRSYVFSNIVVTVEQKRRSGAIDIRFAGSTGDHITRAYTDYEAALVELAKRLGTGYCVFDSLFDGVPYLVDVNPNGQMDYFDDKSIVEELEDHFFRMIGAE